MFSQNLYVKNKLLETLGVNMKEKNNEHVDENKKKKELLKKILKRIGIHIIVSIFKKLMYKLFIFFKELIFENIEVEDII